MPLRAEDSGPSLSLDNQVRTQVLLMAELIDATPHWLHNEAGLLQAWSGWLALAREQLAGAGGRMVKAVGDSCMMRFDAAPRACELADSLLQAWRTVEQVERAELPGLRIAVHESRVLLDAEDLYGSGPNLGARLCGLGSSGQIVVSRPVLQALPEAAQAGFRDLGHCYLKHWPAPVHAFVRDVPTSGPEGVWPGAAHRPRAPHNRPAPDPSSRG